jgi:phosphate starvation-inducible protein PhoH
VAFVELTSKDVVRHRLVQRIVTAYSAYEEAKSAATDG